jgi:hypothetical protein
MGGKQSRQPLPKPPPPRKVVNRTTAGPNTGSGKGNAHAGKGNPHGRGKR